MKISTFLSFSLLLVLLMYGCKDKTTDPAPSTVGGGKKFNSALANTLDSKFLTDWTDLHFKLIKNSAGFVTPVAARSLAYTSLANYESLVTGMPGYQSMAKQLNGLSTLPQADSTKEYNWALAATTAQYTVLKELFITSGDKNQKLIDSLRSVYEVKYKTGLNDAAIQNSIRFGAAVAVSVLEYAKKDGGSTGSSSNYPKSYLIPVGIGAWKPTGPQKIPLLPTWGKNRTFLTANADEAIVDAPLPFSFEKTTEYFKEVKKLLAQTKLNTPAENKTSTFFENNENTLSIAGHLYRIMTNIAKEKTYKLDQLAAIYLKMGLALSDAHVSCWKAKYQSNTIRPQTYINEAIDKNWKPYLSTPPLPEYPSEHAMAAGAFGAIIENEFGKDITVLDNTFDGIIANRPYTSLEKYLNEITASREYGGVNYPLSGTAGLKAGKKIAANIIKLKIKK